MDATNGAAIGSVTLFDVDGAECGKIYATVAGEICLEWGYKDRAVAVVFDPGDIDAVTTALRMVKHAAT